MIEIDTMAKAFRHCASDNPNGCLGCPLCGTDDDYCQLVLFREAADALERLKKENDHMKAIDAKERLATENANLHERLIEKNTELKRITAERDAAKTDIAALHKQLADAYASIELASDACKTIEARYKSQLAEKEIELQTMRIAANQYKHDFISRTKTAEQMLNSGIQYETSGVIDK